MSAPPLNRPCRRRCAVERVHSRAARAVECVDACHGRFDLGSYREAGESPSRYGRARRLLADARLASPQRSRSTGWHWRRREPRAHPDHTFSRDTRLTLSRDDAALTRRRGGRAAHIWRASRSSSSTATGTWPMRSTPSLRAPSARRSPTTRPSASDMIAPAAVPLDADVEWGKAMDRRRSSPWTTRTFAGRALIAWSWVARRRPVRPCGRAFTKARKEPCSGGGAARRSQSAVCSANLSSRQDCAFGRHPYTRARRSRRRPP